MEVLIGNIDYKDIGLNKALLHYKAFTLIGKDDNPYFSMIEKFLKVSAPDKISLYGIEDFILGKNEQLIFKKELHEFLTSLIKHKKEYPIGTQGDIKRVLDKNIRIHLKDREDIVINTFHRLYEIVEDCLEEKKVMYFSVVEK